MNGDRPNSAADQTQQFHHYQQQGNWPHLQPDGLSAPFQTTSPMASPTDSTFPFYHHHADHGEYRPSTSSLSLNLSSLSVASSSSSSTSPHTLHNPSGSDLPATPNSTTPQQHVFAPQPANTQFAYNPLASDWNGYSENPQGHQQEFSQPIAPSGRSHAQPLSLRQSVSMDENVMFESLRRHDQLSQSPAYDENEGGFMHYAADAHESPAEGSGGSDHTDEFRAAIESSSYPPPEGRSPGTSQGLKGAARPGGVNFVAKLYQMISDPKSAHFISWTELGTSFVVSSVGEFSRSILGSHFKHNNFSSFVRQLNMYGFHKVNRTPRTQRSSSDNQVWEFSHQKFLRGRPDLLDEIKRKALDTDPSARQRVDLPAEVAAQLGRMSVDHQQVIHALHAERAKVDRLTSVVKAMYDVMQQTIPGTPNLPFPMDLLEPTETPPILITSPSDSPYFDSAPYESSSTSSSFWSDLGSGLGGPLATISPNSSPTSADFPATVSVPQHAPLPPQAHIHHHQQPPRPVLPPMNIPSLPRFDAPNSAVTMPLSPSDDTSDPTRPQSQGRSTGAKRQRMNHESSSGAGSMPSSAIHPVDQHQQIPPRAHGGGRTLARARSDSAPLGLGLGAIWGSGGRPRSGTHLAQARNGAGRREDHGGFARSGVALASSMHHDTMHHDSLVKEETDQIGQ